MTDRRRSGAARRGAQARRMGEDSGGPRRIGPIEITPTSVLLVVALVGSLGYFLYTLTVRDPSQIPLMAAGLVVLGAVFAAIAGVGLIATWRSSISGRDGRALGHALLGGVACLAAAGCFSLAIILGMLSR